MRNVYSVIAGLAMLLCSVAAMSHHSFSAEFDVGRPIDITGKVINVEWVNPHVWMHLAVDDEQGNTQSWAVELLGVNALVRRGMSPKTVKPGDELTVTGFGSRDGTNSANASSVVRTVTGETLWQSASSARN